MSGTAENTADTPVSRGPERTEEHTNEIPHDWTIESRKGSRRTCGHWISKYPHWPNCWTNWQKKPWNVISQRQILVLRRHNRDSHRVMKREPLEPCQQVNSRVRDFRPTISNTILGPTRFDFRKSLKIFLFTFCINCSITFNKAVLLIVLGQDTRVDNHVEIWRWCYDMVWSWWFIFSRE